MVRGLATPGVEIETLKKNTQETTEDTDHKSFCDTELITTKHTRDSKMKESDELTAESEKFTAEVRQLVAEIAALGDETGALDVMKAKKVKK